MKIVSLQRFVVIPDMHQPEHDGAKSMFISQVDAKGNPSVYEIKEYYSYPAPPEQTETNE